MYGHESVYDGIQEVNAFVSEFEDIHICGACRAEFNNLDEFLHHKQRCKLQRKIQLAREYRKAKSLKAAENAKNNDGDSGATIKRLSGGNDTICAESETGSRVETEKLIIERTDEHGNGSKKEDGGQTKNDSQCITDRIPRSVDSVGEERSFESSCMEFGQHSKKMGKTVTFQDGASVHIDAGIANRSSVRPSHELIDTVEILRTSSELSNRNRKEDQLSQSSITTLPQHVSVELGPDITKCGAVTSEDVVKTGFVHPMPPSVQLNCDPATCISNSQIDSPTSRTVFTLSRTEPKSAFARYDTLKHTPSTATVANKPPEPRTEPFLPSHIASDIESTDSFDQQVDVEMEQIHEQMMNQEAATERIVETRFRKEPRASVRGSGNEKQSPKLYACERQGCYFSSRRSVDLKRHVQSVHLKVVSHTCAICGAVFNRADSLRRHETTTHQIHKPAASPKEPVVNKCDICSKTFASKSILTRHQRVHSNEKPHSCTKCDFATKLKQNLKAHIRFHHSHSEPLSCTQCDFTTSSRQILYEHTRQHAPHLYEQCSVCRQYIKKTSMYIHLQSHEKPNFRCDFCDFVTNYKHSLSKHLLQKHKVVYEISRKEVRIAPMDYSRSSESQAQVAYNSTTLS